MLPKRKGKSKGSYRRTENTREERSSSRDYPLKVTFTKMNKGQSNCFWEWIEDVRDDKTLFDKMLSRLREISTKTIFELIQDQILTPYGKMPASCGMTRPDHINDQDNERWASLKIEGRPRLIGILSYEEHLFEVVFLDKLHQFWPSKLKHT